MTQLPGQAHRSLLERLFAVDRAEHSVGVRLLLGLPLPLLLLLLQPWLGTPGSALMWFVASTTVFLSGWLGGFVSGVTATLASALILHQQFLPLHDAQHWFGSDEMFEFLAFVAAGLVVSLLHGRLRATVRKLDERRILARTQARQLEETRAQLEEARARLEFALDATDIGFWRWEFESGRVAWDHRVSNWFELAAIPRSELTYDHWLSRLHPDDAGHAVETVRQALDDGKPRLIAYRLALPSGADRHIKTSGVLERDGTGRPVALIGIHQDVTTEFLNARELQAREREVHALNRQLEDTVAERTAALLDALLHAEAATHAKAAFLRNISHELRTPLNPILGCAHLLAQSITDPEQLAHLKHIEHGGRRLLDLVTNLIELTSASDDGASHTAIDIQALIDAAIDTFALPAADKGLQVESSVDASIPKALSGDAVRASQVLLQLLSNAIKFSERGRIRVRSTLGRVGPGFVFVRFEVQDEGIGIEPDMQRHIFDVFRQARDTKASRVDGLGLGLALSKRAVERMGGEIGVESEPDAGSTFWFTARFLPEPEALIPAADERRYG